MTTIQETAAGKRTNVTAYTAPAGERLAALMAAGISRQRVVMPLIFATLVISYLATLYPARQAAKINPVDSIRYS